MTNIWKIGSWPGVGKKTKENKLKYIHKYALLKGFVGLGSDYLPDLTGKSIDDIKILIRKRNSKNKTPISIGKRAKQVFDFANNILKGDVILLYNRKSAYVGIAKENPDNQSEKSYYYAPEDDPRDFVKDFDRGDRISHRINVEWKPFGKELFDKVCLTWNDTVHQVLEADLGKIKNEKLKNYLKNKLAE